MHDEHANAEGEHGHHHPLPPPEPDNVAVLPAIAWGVGSFVGLLVTIGLLSGYFWMERRAEDHVKVYESYEPKAMLEAKVAPAKQLESFRKLENGKVQIPVNEAMKIIAKDRP